MHERKASYIHLSDSEWKSLDNIISTVGYKSRSDYFTACAYLTIYGKLLPEYAEADKPIKNGIKKFRTLAEIIERQQKTFFKILSDRKMLPVLARRDTKTIIKSLRPELEKEMLEECGMIPETSQMEKWTEIFKSMKGAELLEFRIESANTEVCL